jgi:cytoskeletal protein RodZ
MAKRETEIEPLDEVAAEQDAPTVGQQLRAAREKSKVTLDDIAAQTRIPKRHLESLENSEWDQLPAPTYTLGFAKSYASAVGLDRTDIGDQLRAEMGGQRFTANTTETFEPADPRRTMPKSLVIGMIVAVIVLIALMSWLNNRSLETTDETGNITADQAVAPAAKPVAQAAAPAQNLPVVINASDAVWLQVYEKGGATFFSGILQPGQTFAVPTTSKAPLLKTAKPEALRISVGNQIARPVGEAAEKVSDVSLLSGDLMKGPVASAPAPHAAPPAAMPQAPRAPRRHSEAAAGGRSTDAPETAPVTETPTTNTGE